MCSEVYKQVFSLLVGAEEQGWWGLCVIKMFYGPFMGLLLNGCPSKLFTRAIKDQGNCSNPITKHLNPQLLLGWKDPLSSRGLRKDGSRCAVCLLHSSGSQVPSQPQHSVCLQVVPGVQHWVSAPRCLLLEMESFSIHHWLSQLQIF